MLDLHASGGTPGATTTYTALATLIANDGTTSAGIPTAGTSDKPARLIMWGSGSLVANTIYGTQLRSLDSVDTVNGEMLRIGTASLKNLVYKLTNIPFKSGARVIGQSTNTAQTATSFGFTLDAYDNEPGSVSPDSFGGRFAPDVVVQAQTQGAADLVLSWYNTPFAPTSPLPIGRYALLGSWMALSTGPHLVRFQHADFKGKTPGYPMVDSFGSAILGAQEGMLDPLWANAGYQFVYLSEISKKPCVPAFSTQSTGTGLGIQSLATVTTDTPYHILNLAKIG